MADDEGKPHDDKVLNDLRDLLKSGIVQQLRLVDALKGGVLQSLAGGDLIGLGQRIAAAAPGVLTGVARSSLEAHTEMMKIQSKHFEKVGDVLFGHKNDCKLSVKTKTEPGKAAIGRFRLKNPTNHDVTVRFTTPSLCSVEQKRLEASITFRRIDQHGHHCPGDIVLTPTDKDPARIEVQVDVPSNAETAAYAGQFEVVAGGNVAGSVTLQVEVYVAPVGRVLTATANEGDTQTVTPETFYLKNHLAKAALVSIGGVVELVNKEAGKEFLATLSLIRARGGELVLEAGEEGLFQVSLGIDNNEGAGEYKGETHVLLGPEPAFRLGIALTITA